LRSSIRNQARELGLVAAHLRDEPLRVSLVLYLKGVRRRRMRSCTQHIRRHSGLYRRVVVSGFAILVPLPEEVGFLWRVFVEKLHLG
jgi:hypothetical protein